MEKETKEERISRLKKDLLKLETSGHGKSDEARTLRFLINVSKNKKEKGSKIRKYVRGEKAMTYKEIEKEIENAYPTDAKRILTIIETNLKVIAASAIGIVVTLAVVFAIAWAAGKGWFAATK